MGEENLTNYKSQVEALTKEIEEQDRSYKSRLAAQEKRAHENWVTARQLERRLEEMKTEGTQLRQRLTQVEKEKEALIIAKENGATTNGGMDADIHQPLTKHLLGNLITNTDDMALMEPPLLSPPIPPPGLDIGLVPPPGMPAYDALFPPGHFIPPAPFMPPEHGMIPPMFGGSAIPPPPPELVMADHRPPTLGMISSNSFDTDSGETWWNHHLLLVTMHHLTVDILLPWARTGVYAPIDLIVMMTIIGLYLLTADKVVDLDPWVVAETLLLIPQVIPLYHPLFIPPTQCNPLKTGRTDISDHRCERKAFEILQVQKHRHLLFTRQTAENAATAADKCLIDATPPSRLLDNLRNNS